MSTQKCRVKKPYLDDSLKRLCPGYLVVSDPLHAPAQYILLVNTLAGRVGTHRKSSLASRISSLFNIELSPTLRHFILDILQSSIPKVSPPPHGLLESQELLNLEDCFVWN